MEKFFECPICGIKSYNPNDIKERYCGKCHKFPYEEIKMPDGRPLFAWENELEMLRASGGILKKRIKEFEDLERVFNFAVLH